MNADTLSVLALYYDHVDIFFLILTRVLGFIMLVPVISGANIPMMVKLLVSIALSAVIFSSGVVTTVTYNDTITGYFFLMITEFLTGMLLGYILFFIFNIIYYAGQLIDHQIGLSMMSVLDPITQIQVPIVGNLYYLAISALLVVTGGLHSFIGAFYFSYQALPVGTAHLIGNAPLAWFVLKLLTEFLLIGVKIALPIVGSILLIDAALGILVKAVPQMNVFVVGMPVKLLIGLYLLLYVMSPTLIVIYEYLFDMAYNALIDLIWGLSP